MAADGSLIRRVLLPIDLWAVIATVVLVTLVVFVPAARETPLRIPLALAFLLFVPGYAAVAAIFPERGDSPLADDRAQSVNGSIERALSRPGISGMERLVLSFGLSVTLVPLLGLGLLISPVDNGITQVTVLLGATTVFATVIAAIRRWRLPQDEQFRVPYLEWIATGRSALLEPDTSLEAALNAAIVIAVLIAAVSVGYAVAAPEGGEQFSAIYLATESDDGEMIAGNYSTIDVNDPEPIIVGVENHEHDSVEYTVVAVEQRINGSGEETVVNEQRELDRFEMRLDHGETRTIEHEPNLTMAGTDVRVVWLLYPEDVPNVPSTEDTPYHVHLWTAENDSPNMSEAVIAGVQ